MWAFRWVSKPTVPAIHVWQMFTRRAAILFFAVHMLRFMAILRPFRALRPIPSHAAAVASVPYDVIDLAEARVLAQGKPHSFLRVIRPELDLPSDVDEYDEAVYLHGAKNLQQYSDSSISVRDEAPNLYLYQLQLGEHVQTGVFGCVAVEEYKADGILRHEKTRPAKEADRTRHMLAQRAHAEPVMLCFRDDPQVAALIEEETRADPLYDLTTANGVRHRIWQVAAPGALVDTFGTIAPLYIADGHHRCKAASRVADALDENDPAAAANVQHFPAALFPIGDMQILPYHRLVTALPGTPADFLEACTHALSVRALEEETTSTGPDAPGVVHLYLDGHWYTLTLPPTQRETVADTLDVARLSEYVLEPLLDIEDLRRDERIAFVGGSHPPAELAHRVDRGAAQAAFAMYPTSIEELLAVSDAGLLMPPKSTWFEPKLSSGLLVHLFDGK